MDIKGILLDERAELERRMKGIQVLPRELEHYLSGYKVSKLPKVIIGIRRSGKSVLTYNIIGKDFAYANFDDLTLASSDENSILSFLVEIYGKSVNTIFLDEVQNLKNWELFVNRLYNAGFNLFITGSNANLLSKELATRLTGRHLSIELFPLSFREVLGFNNYNTRDETTINRGEIKNLLDNYMKTGGFPEVVINNEDYMLYAKGLYNDIIEKDIIVRYNVKYKTTFREIASTVINMFGRDLSYNRLKNQFSLGSSHTTKNYVSYLQDSYLIFSISNFSFKPVEIEKSSKKVYVIDPGIINSISTRTSSNTGRMMENIVAIDIFRRRSYFNLNFDVYYLKTQSYEVDFVLKENLKIKEIIQVTYANERRNVETREISGLLKASALLKCNDLKIITWDYEAEEKIEGKTIKFIPLWKWLLNVK